MNVSELIELTGQLSIAEIGTTAKEKQLYLACLNLANAELYTIAAAGLKTIVKRVELFLDDATQSFLMPLDLYKIRTVYINKKKLLSADIDDIQDLSTDKYLVEGSRIYTNLTNTGITYPTKADPSDGSVKKYISLRYVPNPLDLVETIENPVLETDTPVYPVPYHHFLAHGALYHFYFSGKVFVEKMNRIERKWEANKLELANFKNYGL